VGSTSPSEATVETVLDLLAARPASLGDGRLLCVDGPAGSGKTTLATAVAATTGAPVVHTDDLLAGWDGLPGLPETLAALLAPLAEGRRGQAPRWDWAASRFDAHLTLHPAPLLVVEGVGAGALPAAGRATLLVWVEAPHDLRMRRGIERDGELFASQWERWAAAEAAHFADQRTRERADVVVDGTGRASARIRS